MTCPDCGGTALVALCGVEYLGSEGGCVLRGGHFGPHYGPGDVAGDWTPAASCRRCCICSCGSTDAGRGDPTPCRYCGETPTPGEVAA